MKNVLQTTVVGSYPQPDWLIDRATLSKSVPRLRQREIWRIPEPLLELAQDDATILAIRDMERAGIDVQGGSQFTMLGESLINALNTLADRNTIRVGGAMTKFTTVGSTSSALGLWVMGGTAETTPTAEGVSVARFSGPIRQANGTAPFQLAPTVSCYMTNGNLIVDERTMLTVTNDRDILIRGGKLATRVLTVDDLGSATIVARTLRIDQQLTQIERARVAMP